MLTLAAGKAVAVQYAFWASACTGYEATNGTTRYSQMRQELLHVMLVRPVLMPKTSQLHSVTNAILCVQCVHAGQKTTVCSVRCLLSLLVVLQAHTGAPAMHLQCVNEAFPQPERSCVYKLWTVVQEVLVIAHPGFRHLREVVRLVAIPRVFDQHWTLLCTAEVTAVAAHSAPSVVCTAHPYHPVT